MPTRLIVGSVHNFKSTTEPADNFRRPLMVDAWAQTAQNDFCDLYEFENKEEQSKREIELLEKVRVLEENLKAHTELLSQIHETSARTTALLGQQQQQQPQYRMKTIPAETVEKTSQLSPVEKCRYTSPTSSVMYPTESMDSVKYTILAEGAGDVHGEPIEIELAEDDGAFNLNSSADSDRLEICLATEEIEIKTESESMSTHTDVVAYSMSTGTAEHNCTQRNKLEIYQNDSNSFTHQHAPPAKRRSDRCILKSVKRKMLDGSTGIQTNRTDTASAVAGMEKYIDTDHVMVSIGPNNTRISAKIYEGMIWNSASLATRKLLMAIFERKTLATHSMTGKPSPAFKDRGKPLKEMLDPLIIQDIIFAVTRKCNVSEKEVRNAITTKCADENKMMKIQMSKRTPMREINKENFVGGRKSSKFIP